MTTWMMAGVILPVLFGVALASRQLFRMARPRTANPPSLACQDQLLAEVGQRLSQVEEHESTARPRTAVPRLGPDERADRRWVPPQAAGVALRIQTSEGSLRADVADLSRSGFAAHVDSARSWRQGEVLSCTLELIGRPYADLRVRTRYVVFGGEQDPSWRIGFQLAEVDGTDGGRAVERLVEACRTARQAA